MQWSIARMPDESHSCGGAVDATSGSRMMRSAAPAPSKEPKCCFLPRGLVAEDTGFHSEAEREVGTRMSLMVGGLRGADEVVVIPFVGSMRDSRSSDVKIGGRVACMRTAIWTLLEDIFDENGRVCWTNFAGVGVAARAYADKAVCVRCVEVVGDVDYV